MNYALPCIPKEGFGFSNFYLTKLKRPKFDTFSFEVKADTHITIVCRMRYL
jgi:uncharacterized protein (DUF2141 family)